MAEVCIAFLGSPHGFVSLETCLFSSQQLYKYFHLWMAMSQLGFTGLALLCWTIYKFIFFKLAYTKWIFTPDSEVIIISSGKAEAPNLDPTVCIYSSSGKIATEASKLSSGDIPKFLLLNMCSNNYNIPIISTPSYFLKHTKCTSKQYPLLPIDASSHNSYSFL